MDIVDLSENTSPSPADVIDLGDESNDDVIEICEIKDHKSSGQYDHIFKESKLLGEYIEKCFNLENTSGMTRVINRSLIPAYYSTTERFRNSDMWKSVILKAIRQLDLDPAHKFSHVKELCDMMKRKSQKLDDMIANKQKRNEREKRTELRRKKKFQWFQMEISSGKRKRKRNENYNVVLSDDSSSGFEVPLIEIDEYSASNESISDVHVNSSSSVEYQKCDLIEIEIDNLTQVTEEDNVVEVNDKTYYSTSDTSPGKENLINNTNTLPDTLSDIKNTGTIDKNYEAHMNNDNHDSSLNPNISPESLQDSNLKQLRGHTDKEHAIICDSEISSTEISSTVHMDDNCDDNGKNSQDSDLMNNNDTNKYSDTELATTTQKVDEETNNMITDVSILTDDKFIEANKDANNSLLVLDTDDTHKLMSTKEVSKENVEENRLNQANKVSSTCTTLQATDSSCKSITDSTVNDFIEIDDDEENEVVTLDVATKHKFNTVSVERNKSEIKCREHQTNDLIVIDDDDVIKKHVDNKTLSMLNNEGDQLLVPRKAEIYEGTTEDQLMSKIKKIEADIFAYKTRIAALEEEEVNNDSIWSPYIQCEKYKAKIVKLYKDLCKLTGERAVKRREVRLKASNTRSQLCVDKLEDLINSNIGSDGLPHFPDFQDVLQCVREANREGLLAWSRNEIMTEANALFTYCGHALQESRKRREWRDMLSLVKSEAIEDPADSDPDLMARLQANRQTAVKREKDLLDRYSAMSYLPTSTDSTNGKDVCSSDSENESRSDIEQDITTIQVTTRTTGTSQNAHKSCAMDGHIAEKGSMEVHPKNFVKPVFIKTTANVNGFVETNNTAKDLCKITTYGSHPVRKRCTPIKLENNTTDKRRFMYSTSKMSGFSSDPKNILNHNFNLITKVVLQRIELPLSPDFKYTIITDSCNVKDEIVTSESDSNTNLVDVKKEQPVDIQEELDKLGNDFTATVLDIEDPFLVVEISSDEDEDDDFTR